MKLKDKLSLKAKLTEALEKAKGKGVQELLKYLCPVQVEFKLKIFANRNNHDYAILIQVRGDEPFIEDALDLQSFISQVVAERKTNLNFTVKKIIYDRGGKEEGEYICIYLDFKKKEKQNNA